MPAGSREVQAVRALFAAFNAGDIRPALELVAPDLEWEPPTPTARERPYRGPEGLVRWYDEIMKRYDRFSLEGSEIRTVGDRVLVRGRFRATLRGAQLDVAVLSSYEFREGLLARYQGLLDRDDAPDRI